MGFLSEVFGGGSARRKGSAGAVLGNILGTTGKGGGVVGALTGSSGGLLPTIVGTAGGVVGGLEEARQAKKVSRLVNTTVQPGIRNMLPRVLPGAGTVRPPTTGSVVAKATTLTRGLLQGEKSFLDFFPGRGRVVINGAGPVKGSMKPPVQAGLPIPRPKFGPPVFTPPFPPGMPGTPGFGGGGLQFPTPKPRVNGNGNGGRMPVGMRNGRIGDVMVRGRAESLFVGMPGVAAPTFAVHPITGALEDVEQLRAEGFVPKGPRFRWDWRNNRWKQVKARRMNPCNPRAVSRAFRRIGMLDRFIKTHFRLQKTVKVKPKGRKRR